MRPGLKASSVAASRGAAPRVYILFPTHCTAAASLALRVPSEESFLARSRIKTGRVRLRLVECYVDHRLLIECHSLIIEYDNNLSLTTLMKNLHSNYINILFDSDSLVSLTDSR